MQPSVSSTVKIANFEQTKAMNRYSSLNNQHSPTNRAADNSPRKQKLLPELFSANVTDSI